MDNIRTRYMVYLAAAFVTGLTGALIFLTRLRISPEAAFNVVERAACVIFIVVIGGVGRIEGPIVRNGGILHVAGLSIGSGIRTASSSSARSPWW